MNGLSFRKQFQPNYFQILKGEVVKCKSKLCQKLAYKKKGVYFYQHLPYFTSLISIPGVENLLWFLIQLSF